jgi:hypothetical protein
MVDILPLNDEDRLGAVSDDALHSTLAVAQYRELSESLPRLTRLARGE